MRVLIACESSGRVRDAFRRRGHNAWSCDLDPAEDGSPYHLQEDVRNVLKGMPVETYGGVPFYELSAADKEAVNYGIIDPDLAPWDLVIAHPPCTRLCNSGVRWMTDHWVRSQRGDYWHDATANRAALIEAAALFNLFKGCAPRVAIENPIPHCYARDLIGEYSQIIEPWQFWHLDEPGTGEKKATCLWLHNLPPLVPTTPHETGRHQACWRMPPTKDKRQRAIARSRTYLGIADAMAEQWG